MLFTIKDLENLSGIKAHTIRIWEQRYSFLKPRRSETNIRYYTNEELKTILNIALLNKYGFKISHIDKMSPEVIAENVLSLSEAEAKDQLLINELLGSMIDYEIEKFERILNDNIEAEGMEKAVEKVIFPFLEKVGVLWLTNHINPAQEHLVSNVIRRKIIVAVDRLSNKINSTTKVCLFLPEGEYHELSLLLVFYMLKKRGINTIYLGAHTPFSELESVVAIKKPDYLYTHLTSASQNFNFEKFILYLNKKFGKCQTVISGRLTSSYEKKLPSRIAFKRSLSEAKAFIDSLA